jgi:cytochrome b561
MNNQVYSRTYRVLHWAIALTMLGLLTTILLRLGWMEKNHVADIMDPYLREQGVELSRDQLIVLAKKIRKPMWDWHIYLGYVLTGLYVIRMLVPFFGEMKLSNPLRKGLDMRVRFQYGVYAVFYVLVAASLVSGLIIELGPKSLKAQSEEIHELSIYYLLGFIVLHFSGIIWAEIRHDKGIVSRIISRPD